MNKKNSESNIKFLINSFLSLSFNFIVSKKMSYCSRMKRSNMNKNWSNELVKSHNFTFFPRETKPNDKVMLTVAPQKGYRDMFVERKMSFPNLNDFNHVANEHIIKNSTASALGSRRRQLWTTLYDMNTMTMKIDLTKKWYKSLFSKTKNVLRRLRRDAQKLIENLANKEGWEPNKPQWFSLAEIF